MELAILKTIVLILSLQHGLNCVNIHSFLFPKPSLITDGLVFSVDFALKMVISGRGQRR